MPNSTDPDDRYPERHGVVPAGVLDQRRGVAEHQGDRDPQSIAEQVPRQTVVVMLTKDELFVQGEPIVTVAEIHATAGDIIGPLRDALKRPTLVGQEITEKDSPIARSRSWATRHCLRRAEESHGTCTDADYGKISLAVLQKDKPVRPRAAEFVMQGLAHAAH